jgi:2-methylcitrate dehydratase PrpD
MEGLLSETLAWLFATRPPAPVQHKARLLALDTSGCVLAARRHPEVTAFEKRLEAADPGSVGSAAARYAAAACWDEACEGLARAHGRPGIAVLAACGALARRHGLRYGEFLDACVAGYETGARIGEAMRIAPGMHVDASWPSFGVAAGVVKLMGGSAAQALAAVRIAACQMPFSLYLPVATGSNARNTYLAHAAQLGLLAANAALAGVPAPEGALDELKKRALAGALPGAPFTPPGSWLLLEGYFKPYAAVRHVHYGVAAAQALRADLGEDLKQARAIKLATYAEALTYCGNRAPTTAIQAQFSLSWGVACMLATGELSPASYTQEMLARADVRRMEALVALAKDEKLTAAGRRGATLSIELPDETRVLAVDRVPGDPDLPMTLEDVLAKYARYSGPGGPDGAAQLVAPDEARYADVFPALPVL